MKLGIYEKALPKDITWKKRLEIAKELGFDFVEMSVDETDERLSRLKWTKEERLEVVKAMYETDVKIYSMCLSGHRRYPFGSKDAQTREKAFEVMFEAVDLASDLGIRTIQLAGYDVYYEEKTLSSRSFFIENLKKAVNYAASKQVTLAIEIMDDPFINSITKYQKMKQQINSPFLQVYPDVGNLSAWPANDVGYELEKGIQDIVAIHLKDTLAVNGDFPGKFKSVAFGEGCVDFVGCFKTLKRLEYGGAFLIEMWSEVESDPIPHIKAAKTFILDKMKEAEYE